jgi:membrane protein DedA with SNARE-associated domain
MVDYIIRVIGSAGYLGIALLMLIENLFPPIPSELIMPLAGFVVYKGDLSFVGVIIAGVAGSLVGAMGYYLLGKRIGEEKVKTLSRNHGRWLTISPEDIDRAQGWFRRHGNVAVLFCRLVPGIRSLISIPAGISRMHLGAFLFYTLVGSTVWVIALTSAGYFLKSNFQAVEDYLDPVSYILFAALIGIYVVRVIRHK